MELLVGCALGVVSFCSYLTLRDISGDLRQEGILQALKSWRKHRARKMQGGRLYGAGSLTDINFFPPRRSPVPVRIGRDEPEYRLYRPRRYDD